MERPGLWITIYVLAATIVGFLSMGRDKYLAQKGRWRISENMLLAIAALGGSIGSIAGMILFRHKTLHNKFRYGLPAILVLQIVLLIVVL
jgi:uncharacterized membrane protein YsdA (DUF1294 family)